MKWIDYEVPNSVDEAVALLTEGGDKARPMAGGTDLIVMMRTGVVRPDLVVDIKSIPELNEVSYDPKGGLTVGAGVPCYKIYSDKTISKKYPALIDSSSLIGGIQIQGRASVGGNLCNATPSADSIPTLIALGASCKVAGPTGTREIPAEDFCKGVRQNSLGHGELLVSLHFPEPDMHSGARYIRFIPRNEMDIAVVGVGVSVTLGDGTFKSAKISLASVAPTPLLVTKAGEAIAGKPVSDATIEIAAKIARDAAKPISDMRGTIEYRKHLCEVLTKRALKTAVERAKETL